MLNYEQEVELGLNAIDWCVDKNELKVIDLSEKGLQSVYIYEPVRGGKQIIVGSDGKYLAFSSALSLEKVIDDIKNNNLWDKAVEIKKD